MIWYDTGMIWFRYDIIWYDFMIWYDTGMIWYQYVIWYDMILNDMILWYGMIWYDTIPVWYDIDMIWHRYDMMWHRYDMIWHRYDMIWYDMIWYDMIWYDMIWYIILYTPVDLFSIKHYSRGILGSKSCRRHFSYLCSNVWMTTTQRSHVEQSLFIQKDGVKFDHEEHTGACRNNSPKGSMGRRGFTLGTVSFTKNVPISLDNKYN